MQADAISPGQTVVIIDDVIATGAYCYLNITNSTDDRFLTRRFAGGSAAAAGELVEKLGGKLLQYLFIAEITSLGGQSKLKAPVYSMFQFDE
jgi:adenine phosphoribosyltransferase